MHRYAEHDEFVVFAPHPKSILRVRCDDDNQTEVSTVVPEGQPTLVRVLGGEGRVCHLTLRSTTIRIKSLSQLWADVIVDTTINLMSKVFGLVNPIELVKFTVDAVTQR